LKRREITIITAGLLVGAGLAVIIFYSVNLPSKHPDPNKLIEGVSIPVSAAQNEIAPDFQLQGLDGEIKNLSEIQDKITIINFWATWCEPCKVEMTLFEKLYNSHEQELEIWGVNFDEPEERVQKFIEKYEVSFPILLDPGGEVQALYRVRGYPTTYILDREGIVRFHHIGLLTENQLTGYLSQLGVFE
jgi:peroxiredoxin